MSLVQKVKTRYFARKRMAKIKASLFWFLYKTDFLHCTHVCIKHLFSAVMHPPDIIKVTFRFQEAERRQIYGSAYSAVPPPAVTDKFIHHPSSGRSAYIHLKKRAWTPPAVPKRGKGCQKVTLYRIHPRQLINENYHPLLSKTDEIVLQILKRFKPVPRAPCRITAKSVEFSLKLSDLHFSRTAVFCSIFKINPPLENMSDKKCLANTPSPVYCHKFGIIWGTVCFQEPAFLGSADKIACLHICFPLIMRQSTCLH